MGSHPAGGLRPGAEARAEDLARIGHQHHEILGRIEALEASLDGSGDWNEGVTRAIQDLAGVLAEHLDLEERIGFVTMAAQNAPRLSARADDLGDQHVLLRRQIERIVELSRGDGPGTRRVVADAFGRFAANLRAHEALEGELLQTAYLDDLGGGS